MRCMSDMASTRVDGLPKLRTRDPGLARSCELSGTATVLVGVVGGLPSTGGSLALLGSGSGTASSSTLFK